MEPADNLEKYLSVGWQFDGFIFPSWLLVLWFLAERESLINRISRKEKKNEKEKEKKEKKKSKREKKNMNMWCCWTKIPIALLSKMLLKKEKMAKIEKLEQKRVIDSHN